MTITPKTLAQLPAVETYIPGDVLLIIRDGLFHRLNELPQGIQGEPGLPGENGLPATFRREGEWLQWKLSGEVDWINLVPLADIKGESGDAIELQVTATHIQYRVVGDVDWINLIDLAALQGEQGEQGIQGIQGEPGSGGGGIEVDPDYQSHIADRNGASAIATQVVNLDMNYQYNNYLVFFCRPGTQFQINLVNQDIWGNTVGGLYREQDNSAGADSFISFDTAQNVCTTVVIEKVAFNYNVNIHVSHPVDNLFPAFA